MFSASRTSIRRADATLVNTSNKNHNSVVSCQGLKEGEAGGGFARQGLRRTGLGAKPLPPHHLRLPQYPRVHDLDFVVGLCQNRNVEERVIPNKAAESEGKE